MMIGLFGSGKTTTIGKLATYYSKRGYKIAALGLDIHRPAAIDQIEQVCEQAKIKCFTRRNEKDVIKIYNEFEDEYKKYLEESIDIAAIGTVADCMPLIGENRIIVTAGLKQLKKSRSSGIRKLVEEKIHEDLDADVF